MSKKKQHGTPEEELEQIAPTPESEPAQTSACQDSAVEEKKEENPLLSELNAEKEKYIRLYAEYDNFRKRSQKERDAIFADVRSDTIIKILPVYDNLARALSVECSDAAFYKGVEMTMTQLKAIFEKLGVVPIEAVGKKFDPALHNAVMHVEDETRGEGEIVEEFEKGFKLGDKVIRFSMVKVAN